MSDDDTPAGFSDDDPTPTNDIRATLPGYEYGFLDGWRLAGQRWAMAVRVNLICAGVPLHEVEAIVDRVRNGTDAI